MGDKIGGWLMIVVVVAFFGWLFGIMTISIPPEEVLRRKAAIEARGYEAKVLLNGVNFRPYDVDLALDNRMRPIPIKR